MAKPTIKELYTSITKSNFFRNKIVKNFLSLGSIQLLNFLIPLLLTPYLVSIVGIENFGKVAVAQAIITYFNIFTDYGFYITATKTITLNKSNSKLIEKVYSEVFTTKFLLLAISFLLLLALSFFLRGPETSSALYLLSFAMVVGQAMFPTWLFHGLEDMKYISIINFISKLSSVILIVLFIKSPDQYIYINLLFGLGTMLAACFSILLVKAKYKLAFKFCSINSVITQLKEGKDIFVSNFTINIYTNSNLLILGIFASKEIVGFYNIAEKVINAARQLLGIYFQAIYPTMCNMVEKSKKEIVTFLKHFHAPFCACISFICFGVFFFAEEITYYFTNSNTIQIVHLLKLMSFIPLIVALNVPFNQLLLIHNFKESYRSILFVGSILNIGANMLLSYYFQAYGTAVAVILTEIFITFLLILTLEKKKPLFNLFARNKFNPVV